MRSRFFRIVFVLTILSTALWAADDGAALYKKKCAHCHGASGEGKPAMKAPALKGTALDAGAVADQITKGKAGSKAPHTKGISGVTDDQAKAIAAYVKGL
ncbi:cytochrome c, class I [Candidatus Koribacter versatilis Ellin345]|uniref:Cytochrome c, class I n=1 Tax=Koribacter versatilis (strain Ellin345) TaxID=204669 RepID=Q1IJX1_KORVE|nr:cytochrome c [Candidatus Koribacter versatilis]ABF42829.1 cytochrome c, class I [Candidatus Koribacter versatilis Ellin345]